MHYVNPASGATQEVANSNLAKRRTFEAAGWIPCKLLDVTSHDSVTPEYLAIPLNIPPVPPAKPRKVKQVTA